MKYIKLLGLLFLAFSCLGHPRPDHLTGNGRRTFLFISHIDLNIYLTTITRLYRFYLTCSQWSNGFRLPWALRLYSIFMDFIKGMCVSGTFIPKTIPVALSANKAIPHAWIPPIWFCTRRRFAKVTVDSLFDKLSIHIPAVPANFTWKLNRLVRANCWNFWGSPAFWIRRTNEASRLFVDMSTLVFHFFLYWSKSACQWSQQSRQQLKPDLGSFIFWVVNASHDCLSLYWLWELFRREYLPLYLATCRKGWFTSVKFSLSNVVSIM